MDFWQQFNPLTAEILPLPPTFDRETEFVEYLCGELDEHFDIHRELTGTHPVSGRRVRADLAIRPRQPWGCGTSQRPIVIEVKRGYSSIQDASHACAQAVTYAHSRWDVHKLPAHWNTTDAGFVACLAVDFQRLAHSWQDSLTAAIERVNGQNNVGLMSFDRYRGWTIDFSGHRRWSQQAGMTRDRWNAAPKWGAR